MASSINASTTAGLVNTADTSGVLNIQTAGTTAISIDASQAVSFTNSPTVTGGTANGVAYLNGSKVLTTGSALVFDGTNLGVGGTPSYRLDVSKATAGDVARFTNGGASNKSLFVYTDATYAAIATGVGASGNGIALDAVTNKMLFTTASTNQMALDASGNLGIGTTSPAQKLDVYLGTTGTVGQYLRNTTINLLSKIDGTTAAQFGTETSHPLTFITGNTERARIDSSGNLLVGTTSAGDGKVRISASANAFNLLKIDDTGSTGGNFVQFLNSSGAQAGSINHNGTTSVNYGSGSDYRLKDITGPVTNAADFINSLKPKVGTWKADGSKFVGFLAHEFAEVCPQAVVGEKDGVDADGNPIYQSMEASSSEVIANMVSLLQEQQAIIQSLTARITALENK